MNRIDATSALLCDAANLYDSFKVGFSAPYTLSKQAEIAYAAATWPESVYRVENTILTPSLGVLCYILLKGSYGVEAGTHLTQLICKTVDIGATSLAFGVDFTLVNTGEIGQSTDFSLATIDSTRAIICVGDRSGGDQSSKYGGDFTSSWCKILAVSGSST